MDQLRVGRESKILSRSWFSSCLNVVRTNRSRVMLISLAVLLPLFWHSRIQAGDLGSHVYNAWLASQARNPALGLTIVRQPTNVLFDIILEQLLPALGPWAAEHVAVAIAVLTFFWGAFALVSTVHGRPIWLVSPIVAVVTFGWVFNAGFFNFYLSAGLCCFLLAIVWHGRPLDLVIAAPIAGLAVVAHPLPVCWLAGAVLYVSLAQRVSRHLRAGLFLLSITALGCLRFAFQSHFTIQWSPKQLLSSTGLDQIIIYGRKDYLFGAVVMLIAGLAVARFPRRAWQLLWEIPVQMQVLCGIGVFLLPEGILIDPTHGAWLNFLATRMSLFAAVFGCVLLGYIASARRIAGLVGVLAVTRFLFLYADTRELNRIEDQIAQTVRRISPNERVLFLFDWPAAGEQDPHLFYRVDELIASAAAHLPGGRQVINAFGSSRIPWATWHMIDRVCIGQCWSYANYQPTNGIFHLRTTGQSTIVAPIARDAMAMSLGVYVVKPEDPRLLQIYRCSAQRIEFCVRVLQPGETNGSPPERFH